MICDFHSVIADQLIYDCFHCFPVGFNIILAGIALCIEAGKEEGPSGGDIAGGYQAGV